MKQITMYRSVAYIPDDWHTLNPGAAATATEAMAVALRRASGIPVMLYFHDRVRGHEDRGTIAAAQALAIDTITAHGWTLPDPPQWGFFPMPEDPASTDPHALWLGYPDTIRIERSRQ